MAIAVIPHNSSKKFTILGKENYIVMLIFNYLFYLLKYYVCFDIDLAY